jgi:hypothetical protein
MHRPVFPIMPYRSEIKNWSRVYREFKGCQSSESTVSLYPKGKRNQSPAKMRPTSVLFAFATTYSFRGQQPSDNLAQIAGTVSYEDSDHELTMFCILLAMSKVRSAVEPPAPQVMSQKEG